ncbi:MAG: hypothetical protein ACK4MF_08105, partial [Hyphomicrobiaceae bacterium]
RAAQAAHIKEGTAELRRAAKRIKPRDMVDAMLGQSETRNAAVVAFPKRSETHTTPQIEAAREAAMPKAERLRREATRPLTGKAAETHARMVAQFDDGKFNDQSMPLEPVADAARERFEAEFAGEQPAAAHTARAKAARVVSLPETPKHRFRRAYLMEQALERGESVAADDLVWLGGYRIMPEYAAHKTLLADFGVEWLMG